MKYPPEIIEQIMKCDSYVDWHAGVWHCQQHIFISKHVDFLADGYCWMSIYKIKNKHGRATIHKLRIIKNNINTEDLQGSEYDQ